MSVPAYDIEEEVAVDQDELLAKKMQENEEEEDYIATKIGGLMKLDRSDEELKRLRAHFRSEFQRKLSRKRKKEAEEASEDRRVSKLLATGVRGVGWAKGGAYDAGAFSPLSIDVLKNIMSYLEFDSKMALIGSCRGLHGFVKDPSIYYDVTISVVREECNCRKGVAHLFREWPGLLQGVRHLELMPFDDSQIPPAFVEELLKVLTENQVPLEGFYYTGSDVEDGKRFKGTKVRSFLFGFKTLRILHLDERTERIPIPSSVQRPVFPVIESISATERFINLFRFRHIHGSGLPTLRHLTLTIHTYFWWDGLENAFPNLRELVILKEGSRFAQTSYDMSRSKALFNGLEVLDVSARFLFTKLSPMPNARKVSIALITGRGIAEESDELVRATLDCPADCELSISWTRGVFW